MNKGTRRVILAVAMLVCLTSIVSAAPPSGVKFTAHNLGATGGGRFAGGTNYPLTTDTQVCVFCHTPHNSVGVGTKPLWNRNDPVATAYMRYTGSPTLNISSGDKSAPVGEVSKMCMSCHDGATAINAMANPRGGTTSVRLGDVWDPDTMFEGGTWGKNIGEFSATSGWVAGADTANLSNDHPISFDYADVQTRDSRLRAIADVKSAGLRFWGPQQNQLECTTCHDPHINYGSYDYRQPDQHSLGNYDRSLAPFLRRTVSSSTLCFTCHIK